MSEFQNIPVGKQAQEMDISPQFRPYSGVEIIVSEDKSIVWPENDAERNSGRVLRFENPWGTKEQAQNIYTSLVTRGFQYQPYTAGNALVNPAAELGDAVTVNGTYSGIYKMSRNYSSLMAADIEAPQDEEVDHEFPYEPKQDRIYKRELAEARAQIKVNHDSIEAEVFRASEAEGQLSSAIQQTASEISANVLKKTGGSSSSFGWTLTDRSWELKSNNQTVFKATSSGVEISGKVTATSGKIGGFTIGSSALYNGMNSLNSTANGVYIGTNGISVGGGKFKVTSSGAVSAANMTLTGTLTIGGSTITADALRSGAQTAYNRAGTWNGTTTTVSNNSGYWSTGASQAANWNSAKAGYGAAADVWAGSFHSSGRSYFAYVSTYQLTHYGTGRNYNPTTLNINGTNYSVWAARV